ncbi:DUF2950 domain-containing protein [Occallatibacter riparius]|uniref:DUF2950 domain-containing protein n=1 Tax=Occallatibacter riparius TaxID=1002689 RepID=A0A9J7BWQ1_9BACT|nr:DUF2950 domain-containing protein [Occallatibacter riparius]UWZ86242.1 DUF2950 domain-containing protein [Occallatibacter riparius]
MNRLMQIVLLAAVGCVCASSPSTRGQQPAATDKPAAKAPAAKPSATVSGPVAGQKTFANADEAADALIAAANDFNQDEMIKIFGPSVEKLIFSGEPAQDREHAAAFAAKAQQKKSVSADPKNKNRYFLVIGDNDWPFPVPIVKSGSKWFFDTKAGQKELLYRRVGENELDAISVCHGYVDAQYDYAFRQRQAYEPSQFAQRIISTPGNQDGLAWQNADGTWDGPVGEKVAKAIEQGYEEKLNPYHGYYFKILKGQGPAAPLGKLNYVVKGAMIGGFALVAAPAEYRVTGVRTFIVSQDGVVYEKDLGPTTLDQFKSMDLFNPDKSWDPVEDDYSGDQGATTATAGTTQM